LIALKKTVKAAQKTAILHQTYSASSSGLIIDKFAI
jgi:hypothetical protein